MADCRGLQICHTVGSASFEWLYTVNETGYIFESVRTVKAEIGREQACRTSVRFGEDQTVKFQRPPYFSARARSEQPRFNTEFFARRLATALALGVAGGAMSLALAAPAHAQESNASLSGTITGGATQVVAIDVNSGLRRTASVSANGRYNLASLRPGTYRLEITMPSGVRNTDEFTLNVAQNAVLDFDFAAEDAAAPADGSEGADDGAIVVTGNRIRTMEGGEVGTNINQRLIEVLPQNNRNFLAFADLAPGVQFQTASNGESRLQGGAQGSNSVNIFIDGVGQKDYVLKNGVTGQDSTPGNPFPQMAIGEYRVISSNYKAEFDQVSSVAITAITKSGTNEFHGAGFIDFTNQDLREKRPSEIRGNNPGKVKSRDLQFGGSLGGPIIKDIAHFFVTYEGKRIINPRSVTPGMDLDVSYFPTQYQGYFGNTNQRFDENLYFGKIDVLPTDKDLVEFSVKYRDEDGDQFSSGSAAYETRTVTSVKEWRGTARWEHTEDTWVNDLKFTYEDAKWNPRPFLFEDGYLYRARIVDPNGTIRTGDILRTGGGANFQDKGQKGWGISNDFTYTGFDNHTIKAGVKAKWVTLKSNQQNFFNPRYTFNTTFAPASDTDGFNDTVPYRLEIGAPVGTGDPQLSVDNFQFGAYVQDDWDVTDRLTLNLGVRWDFERTPDWLNYEHDPAVIAAVSPANYPNLVNANYDINDYISTGSERKTFMGAFQPRFGFSYDLDEAGRFVVFGGWGRSYSRNQFDFIQQELAQGQFAQRTFNFITGDPNNTCTASPTCVAWNPAYLTEAGRQQLIASAPVGAGRELRFINNDLKMPYSDQLSLGVRGRFNLVNAEVGYQHIKSRDGFAYLLGNRRPDGRFFPVTGNADNPWGFTPSPYGSIIYGTNGIGTNADTAYLKLGKVYTKASPWSIDATYTFSKAEENREFGEYFALDFPSLEDYPWVTSAGVRKHRLVIAGSVDLPIDLTISGKFQIASPKYLQRIYSIQGDPNSRTVSSIETDGNGDRWGYRQMDLSVIKYINLGFINDESRVWLRADVINLFNDRNYNSFNSTTGLRNWNNYDTDGPPRTVKVSAGFSF